jgi:flavin reductase (DIM6/NTAB) family NADH-FMN oxidoreductase RutF
MELDPSELGGYELFRNLGSVVMPRPVGWISTVDESGEDNLAPYSHFAPVSVIPPVVMFTAAPEEDGSMKHTARNAIDTGEFVYNLVTEDLMDRMNETARKVDESEFDTADVAREPSTTVEPPRVANSPACLECTVRESMDVEGTTVVFGDVERFVVDDELVEDDFVDATAFDAVGHVADELYTRMDLFEKEQPKE